MPSSKGVYRIKQDGEPAALVNYGISKGFAIIPKAQYEAEGHKPPFNWLPTREEFENRG
ncbi:hypothetical protein [Hyphomicrobium methylovorum]|uniref:hypothetical protein n=1 Tax=Hyphomicrobium methylovorum TaxID=84 RepID=UPI0015E638E1|nr:hypothetical protein [Hyphomicrobium methylovorum]